MPQVTFSTRVVVELTLKLDEQEIGALDALAGYGTDSFLECFYKNLGMSYLSPYEAGLRSLFDKIRSNTPSALHAISDARKTLDTLNPDGTLKRKPAP